MVDGQERQLAGRRDRLGGHHAYEDAADEPGPGGRGDAVQVIEAHAGVLQRARDQAVDMIEVAARSDFRHDPAIGPVVFQL